MFFGALSRFIHIRNKIKLFRRNRVLLVIFLRFTIAIYFDVAIKVPIMLDLLVRVIQTLYKSMDRYLFYETHLLDWEWF